MNLEVRTQRMLWPAGAPLPPAAPVPTLPPPPSATPAPASDPAPRRLSPLAALETPDPSTVVLKSNKPWPTADVYLAQLHTSGVI